MNHQPTIVLPGLDGTDLLLNSFCKSAPASQDVTVWRLPDDPTADYDTLCDYFSDRIQSYNSCHLIAESFSGPLGILLAHRHPDIVKRLTLVATFAASPVPLAVRLIPWSMLFRLPMPTFIAQYYFVGSDKPLIDELKNAVRQTSPQTLVQRMRCIRNVNVVAQLSELKCAVVYLRPTRDRLVSGHSLNTITKANPSVSVHEIDGSHLILQAKPKLAWGSIAKSHQA